jgi:tRNA(Ile)-lysidine synthase
MTALAWSTRWSRLALAAGLDGQGPLLLALSGGADSVYLLHVLARSDERPLFCAVHVDHGLRGAASRADADFCARLCARLGVPFVLRHLTLDPEPSGLEARAREARYGVLFEEARRIGARAVLTGHHADDALETVLLRWLRGTDLGGIAALRADLRPAEGAPKSPARHPGERLAVGPAARVVRPLFGMRRAEVRRWLEAAGLEWREDESNDDERFARNRVRALLPRLSRLGGERSLDNLRAFGAAVERLEARLADATAHLAWRMPPQALASRSRAEAHLLGRLPRGELMRLPAALRRRALWRLILEACGRGPRRALLSAVLEDLEAGRTARHALPAGHALLLRSHELVCLPPLAEPPRLAPARQLRLDFGDTQAPRETPSLLDADTHPLPVPGEMRLADGRRLCARLERGEPGREPPRGPLDVELDAGAAGAALTVRFARSGDRFRPLGAPGSRPLRRFLADAGVAREERARVPLVLVDGEIAWVAGVRPGERQRVRAPSALRLRLSLEDGALEGALDLPETAALTGAEDGLFAAAAPRG